MQNSFSPGQFLSPFKLSLNCGVIVAWQYGKPGTPELTGTRGSNPYQILQDTITITPSEWAYYAKDKGSIKIFLRSDVPAKLSLPYVAMQGESNATGFPSL